MANTWFKKTLIGTTLSSALVAGSAGAAFAADYVGGGVWDHGKSNGNTYSNYYHGSKAHSATAVGNGTVRTLAAPGNWAQASVKSSLFGNKTYWNAW